MLLCCLESFCGRNSLKTSLFIQKITISERSSEILRKITFLNKFKNEKIWAKFGFSVHKCFCSKQKNGTIFNTNCFYPQNEPHRAKLCFSVVLKHFRGNSLIISLFWSKRDYLRKDHRNTQKVFFFFNKFEKGQIWGKFGFFKQQFLIKPVKRGQIF